MDHLHSINPTTHVGMLLHVQVVDFAPLTVRKAAFEAVGGLDEGLSDQGQCGIWGDWELCTRMWADGWQVRPFSLPHTKMGEKHGLVAHAKTCDTGFFCLAYVARLWHMHAPCTVLDQATCCCPCLLQVMYMGVFGIQRDTEGPSGTHTEESGEKCWGRQMHVARDMYHGRWVGSGFRMCVLSQCSAAR